MLKRLSLFLLVTLPLLAADAPPVARPPLRIQPGEVIVPTDKMRRIWGELVSVDLATRTGKFRNESTNEVMSFTVLPYAELLHHATFGDLQDFRVGERAIFRLHENEAGAWVWLTYIQDEMNFLNNHREYYYLDRVDAAKGELECTDANFDRSFVREKGIVIKTDADTRFWKGGQAAGFADLKIGGRVRTKTHGAGLGKVRVAWEVFLDDESLLEFQAEQKALQARRLAAEGLPGYVDRVESGEIALTLFQEGGEIARKLAPGQPVRLAAAGVDRKPAAAPIAGKVKEMKPAGNLTRLTLTIAETAGDLKPRRLARVWVETKP